MSSKTKSAVAFLLMCLVLQMTLVPSTLANSTAAQMELQDWVGGGLGASTLCGIGIGVVAGSLFFLSGGVLGVVMAVAAPKAAAACIYWAIT